MQCACETFIETPNYLFKCFFCFDNEPNQTSWDEIYYSIFVSCVVLNARESMDESSKHGGVSRLDGPFTATALLHTFILLKIAMHSLKLFFSFFIKIKVLPTFYFQSLYWLIIKEVNQWDINNRIRMKTKINYYSFLFCKNSELCVEICRSVWTPTGGD